MAATVARRSADGGEGCRFCGAPIANFSIRKSLSRRQHNRVNGGGGVDFLFHRLCREHLDARAWLPDDGNECDSETDRARMERRVRALSQAICSDADADVWDSTTKWLVDFGPGWRALPACDRRALETVHLLVRACFCRAALRESCEFHGWRRTLRPEEVPFEEELETCPGCTEYCGTLPDEERIKSEALRVSPGVCDLAACPCGYVAAEEDAVAMAVVGS
jgi:hypothetical protein